MYTDNKTTLCQEIDLNKVIHANQTRENSKYEDKKPDLKIYKIEKFKKHQKNNPDQKPQVIESSQQALSKEGDIQGKQKEGQLHSEIHCKILPKKNEKEKKQNRKFYKSRNKLTSNLDMIQTHKEEKHLFEKSEWTNETFGTDKSLVSSGSTETSDQIKIVNEENLGSKKDKVKKRNKKNQSKKRNAKEKHFENILEVVIHNEQGRNNIKLSKEENNFEDLLKEICTANKISGREELYFKINLLKSIQDSQKVPQKSLETYLNKLLDLNYQLILSDNLFEDSSELDSYYLGQQNKLFLDDNCYHQTQTNWFLNRGEFHQMQGF